MDSKPHNPLVKGAPVMAVNKWKIDSIQIREKTYGARPLKRRNSEPVFKLEECLHTFSFNGIPNKEFDAMQNSSETMNIPPINPTKEENTTEHTTTVSQTQRPLQKSKPTEPINSEEPPVKKARSFPILPGDLKSLNKGHPLPKQSSLPKLPSYNDLINSREHAFQQPIPLQIPHWSASDQSSPEKIMLKNLTSKFFHFVLEKDRITASQHS